MILGSQVEWAVHAALILSLLPEGARLSAKELAEFHEVPKEYLAKALQSLAQARIVESSLGACGGYRLAQAADDISILNIVEAIEGEGRTFVCSEIRQNGPCQVAKREYSPVCEVARTMWVADQAWRAVLSAKKLSEIAAVIEEQATPAIRKKTQMWFASKLMRHRNESN